MPELNTVHGIVAYTFFNVCEKICQSLSSVKKDAHTRKLVNFFLPHSVYAACVLIAAVFEAPLPGRDAYDLSSIPLPQDGPRDSFLGPVGHRPSPSISDHGSSAVAAAAGEHLPVSCHLTTRIIHHSLSLTFHA